MEFLSYKEKENMELNEVKSFDQDVIKRKH